MVFKVYNKFDVEKYITNIVLIMLVQYIFYMGIHKCCCVDKYRLSN